MIDARQSNAAAIASSDKSCSLAALLSRWIELPAALDCQVTGVHVDSRRLQPGFVFIALAGETSHGLDFVADAITAEVAAIVVERADVRLASLDSAALQAANIVLLEFVDLRARAGEIASVFYADPSSAMKLIGITGTDGKTSVCELLAQALNAGSVTSGSIGTLGSSFGNRRIDFGLTTPDAVSLQQMLADFRDQGASYVSMEVSSHAICQSRIAGVRYDVAVLTNLGRDHLDYHGSMEHYRAAKEVLFQLPEVRAAVLNTDDTFGADLATRLDIPELYSFGQQASAGDRHVGIRAIGQHAQGLSFVLTWAGVDYPVNSRLIGAFNVYNLAAVFTCLLALGISPALAARTIEQLLPVRGRMELATRHNGGRLVVDYAHNPHALKSVLSSVREHLQGKLIVVFGCGGDRDAGKRPMMGSIAEQLADVCIVTDDNPRTEDGDQIIRQILDGMQSSEVIVERDRALAIGRAMAMADSDDWVVIAGKGHEQYQQIGDQRLFFSDSSVVAEYLSREGRA